MADIRKVYGVKHKSEDVRAASRSGGFFTAVSDVVLENNGVVYGCALNEQFLAEHRRAATKEERNLFRGSKYVQSDMNDIPCQVEADLKNGTTVLFSGVPCQVHGLLNYLKLKNVDTTNLLTIDILCYGVPSPKVWRDFLKHKFDFSKITDVNFRNKKKFGWRSHYETIKIDNEEFSSNQYAGLFSTKLILRQSCFNCYYKNTNRISDITIGDFWKIENNDKAYDDNKGISLVKTNTVKGKEYFDLCKNSLIVNEYYLANCIQPVLSFNYKEPSKRSQFWEEYNGDNILQLAEKYTAKPKQGFKTKIKSLLKRIIKRAIKLLVK